MQGWIGRVEVERSSTASSKKDRVAAQREDGRPPESQTKIDLSSWRQIHETYIEYRQVAAMSWALRVRFESINRWRPELAFPAIILFSFCAFPHGSN